MNCHICRPVTQLKMSSGEEEMSELASDMQDQIASKRKERGVAKGALTRLVNSIGKMSRIKENVPQIKEKVSLVPETVQRFEDAHQCYVNVLEDPDAIEEARLFRKKVLTEVEGFEQEILMWVARKEETDEQDDEEETYEQEDENTEDDAVACDEPLTAPDLIALEEDYRKTAQVLADIERARELEEKIHKMKLEAQRSKLQLKELKIQNEMQLRREEQANLAREWKQLTTEHSETKGMGPTLNKPFMSTPGHVDGGRTIPVRSTFKESSARKSRSSWEPLGAASEEDEQMSLVKTVIAGVVGEVLNESRVQQQSIVDSLQLPRRELQTFDGDSLQYWPFIRSFRTTVDAKNIDSASKLSCLLQYCKGSARKILNCCETMDPEDGYVRALEILEDRYGNNYEISQKWIRRITDRPNLKGPTELREFADDLKCCQQTLKNMGHESELDNAASLQIIWKKQPQYLQDRWSCENFVIKKKENT